MGIQKLIEHGLAAMFNQTENINNNGMHYYASFS